MDCRWRWWGWWCSSILRMLTLTRRFTHRCNVVGAGGVAEPVFTKLYRRIWRFTTVLHLSGMEILMRQVAVVAGAVPAYLYNSTSNYGTDGNHGGSGGGAERTGQAGCQSLIGGLGWYPRALAIMAVTRIAKCWQIMISAGGGGGGAGAVGRDGRLQPVGKSW